jgi:hypothetical protein
MIDTKAVRAQADVVEHIGTFQAGALVTETGITWHPANDLLPAATMLRQCVDEIDTLRREGEYGDTPLFDRTSLEERIAILEIGNREKQAEIDTLRELVREANRDGVVPATWFDRAEKALNADL